MAVEMKKLTVDASNGSFTFEVVDAEARELVGSLEDLTTTNKGSIVAAINELVRSLGSGSAIRVAEVNLLANRWEGAASPYSQVVTIAGVTEYTQVDLTPSAEQLSIFHDKDLAFVTENEDGVVTVYAIGQKPENDYTIQVTLKEVSV